MIQLICLFNLVIMAKTPSTNKKGKAPVKVKAKRQTYTLSFKNKVRAWHMVDRMSTKDILKKLKLEFNMEISRSTLST